MNRWAIMSFIARRLLAMALLLVIVSFLIFSLIYISPGNVVTTLLGRRPPTPEMVQALTEEYHLDEPFFTQYWMWANDALRFDFGNSIQTSLPVIDEITARLPTTLFLAVYSFILTIMLGVTLGIGSALKKQTSVDRGIVAFAVVGMSMPAFVSGVLLLYVFAILLPWFPVFGRGTGFFDQLWHLTLPAIAMAVTSVAYVVKHTRASMATVLDSDFVTFARARGLSGRRVLFSHALRNALIPVVTISALTLSGLIIGAVFVEVTFSLPGIGGLLVQSASSQDLPMIQGVGMLVAVVIMAANLLADLAYMAADPRIRVGRATA